MSAKPDPNDPTTWPVADAVPADVFLGVFTHDCTPHLTEEQKAWPVADCEPADVFLGVFTEVCIPAPAADRPQAQPGGSSTPVPPRAEQHQPPPPSRPGTAGGVTPG